MVDGRYCRECSCVCAGEIGEAVKSRAQGQSGGDSKIATQTYILIIPTYIEIKSF